MTTIQLKSSAVAGNVPQSLTAGELAINQADGVMYWADSSGTIQATPLYAAAIEALADNNLAVNAAMEVSQFNGNSQITLVNGVTAYVVDQFLAAYNNSGAEFVAQQVTPPDTPPFGTRLIQCLQMQSTSAVASYAANDFAIIRTPIEGTRWARLGYGAAGAAQVTVGFWCYADVAGTAAVSIQNSLSNRSCPVSFTVKTGWQWITVVVPGDTAGTWNYDTNLAAYVTWCFGCGGNYQGTENTWSSFNNYGSSRTTNFFTGNTSRVAITGVVVLTGSQAIVSTHASFLSFPFDKELQNCQRYYSKSYDSTTKPGSTVNQNGVSSFYMSGLPSGNYNAGHDERFATPMRTVPTMIGYSPHSGTSGRAYDNINASDVAVSLKYIGENGFRWNAQNSAAATAVDMQLQWVADARM